MGLMQTKTPTTGADFCVVWTPQPRRIMMLKRGPRLARVGSLEGFWGLLNTIHVEGGTEGMTGVRIMSIGEASYGDR